MWYVWEEIHRVGTVNLKRKGYPLTMYKMCDPGYVNTLIPPPKKYIYIYIYWVFMIMCLVMIFIKGKAIDESQ